MTRRDFLLASAGTIASLSVLGPGGSFSGTDEARASALSSLEIFQRGYPRAFFFLRQLENDVISGSLSYQEWKNKYLPLNGVLGKVLSEERSYVRTDNLPYLRRYKTENPGKLLLLYYNGRGRGPTDDAAARFFPGHWLYYAGTKLSRKVSAKASEIALRVSKTAVFSMGRYGASLADDIVISSVGSDGKPNWERVEHARLKRIIPSTKTIVVERGAYWSRPLFFREGAYVAAHVTTMSYPAQTGENVPFWSYNYSTASPRDANGRTGAKALADYLVEKLRSGGALSAFDGITFDAFDFVPEGRPATAIDVNGDGKGDGGVFSGLNTYGLGTMHFTYDLRRGLPGKLIIADGTFPERLQRSFRHLNGAESEGYPDLFDRNLNNTSKARNVFNYWRANSASPSLNYVNFKYRQSNPPRNKNTFTEPNLSEDQSYRKMRLVLASAQFTDAAFTSPPDWTPPETLWKKENTNVHIFDELWQGVDQKPNWLGMPKGPAVLMAEKAPDILGRRGETWPGTFIGRFRGDGVSFARLDRGTGMIVRATSTKTRIPVLSRTMNFKLPDIQVTNKDLFVSLKLSARSLKGYPTSVARRIYVTATRGGLKRESFTWAGGNPFAAKFFFRDVGPGPVDLNFRAEGDAPVRFHRLVAHSAADAVYRQFENGVVFANYSDRSYTFDLGRLFPNASFRRIQGTSSQDPTTNNGQPVGATLTLGPRDALFVVRSAG